MYQIDSYGNEYWGSTCWKKTLQEALEEYNKELVAAKYNADEFGPIRVSIIDTNTKEIIASKTFKTCDEEPGKDKCIHVIY